jgi:hypothetical protein
MGNTQLVKEAIQNPENETSVRNLFYSIDVDKSGFLDEEEFKKFAVAFVKQNPKFSKIDVDIDLLSHKLFLVADLNNNGRVSYSEFHGLITNMELLDKTIQNIDKQPDKQNKQMNINIKVYLLELPPPVPLMALSSLNSATASIDKLSSFKSMTNNIHSLLLPNEGRQEFVYYLNNSEVPVNSNLTLGDYINKVNTGNEKEDYLLVFPVTNYRKYFTTYFPNLEVKQIARAEYTESMTMKLNKSQKQAQKVTVAIVECLLYLLIPKETKGGGQDIKILFLNNCKLFEEDDNGFR